ncbi:MAG: hypothetical protein AB1801_16635 [Chloroflexota bacterium]
MKKWMLVSIVLGVVVLVAGLALTPLALAQGPANSNDGFGFARGPMMRTAFGPARQMGQAGGPALGMGPRWGGQTGSLVAVAAEQLGMTQAELVAELQAGKTIADVAAEKGVALETIVDAFVALRAGRLAELVANGQLTQEQADAMLAAMKANVTARLSQAWTPRGPGYVDQDGDGQCDNFVDEDGDGVCDYAGQGRGAGYVDEDGDGVCDYAGSGPGRGAGRGAGMMGRWTW